MKSVRVGLGFDVHRFTKKKKGIILGGVKIPCAFGVRAVSDGDVLLHAISDGILGAASLGDIGDYFPPADKKSKGIKSSDIVRYVLKKIEKKFKLINVDTIIVAQKPVMASYKRKMVRSLIKILGTNNINVKIKSKEGLDILGGVDSIACLCIIALKRC